MQKAAVWASNLLPWQRVMILYRAVGRGSRSDKDDENKTTGFADIKGK